MKKKLRQSDTCRVCGRPLTDPDSELCAACRAMESVRARGGARAAAVVKRPRRRMNGTTRVMLIFVCVLAVLFVGLCVLSNVLYEKYNPERFFTSLDETLAAGDARALTAMTQSDDLAVSGEGAAALCLAFSASDDRAALLDQLRAQLIDPKAAGAFPAVSLVKTRAVFGYGRYALNVRSASLLLRAPAREVRLSLDGVPRQGEQTADGILYRNIFPGQYTCVVTGVTSAGQPVSGAPTPVRLLQDAQPVVFDGALPVAAVTVSGCVSDEAVIMVDGTTVAQRPENGVVTLPQLAVGSVIEMRYTAPWGAVTTARAAFERVDETSLAFSEPVTQGGVPDADTLTPLLNVFFGTYLDAINNQDPTRITGCTEACRAAMNAADGSIFQTGHVFVLESSACAPLIASETVDGAPRVTCCARMTYRIVNRETNEERTLTDYAWCAFVWQDGWVVDAYTVTDESAFLTASSSPQG